MGRKKKRLEDAIDDLIDLQLDEIIRVTTNDVGRKLKKDMESHTKKIIKHYYDNYDPVKYTDRSYELYNAYTVLNQTSGNKARVMVEFDSDLIKGAHSSDSKYHQTGDVWQKIAWPAEIPQGDGYGIPDSEWILENFWRGEHPRTYGNKYIGFKYHPAIDVKSPQALFDEFVNGTYIDRVLKPYAQNILTTRVLKALRRQYR
jgi:hypothetical protein